MENKIPRERAKEKACDIAIIKSLTYSNLFKYPMSFYQLSSYLISRRDYDFEFFIKSLKRLVKKKHIRAIDAKFFLPGIRPVSWDLRQKYSKELIDESTKYLTLLKAVPWIKFIGITGSVAASNATKDDDIDIFIITGKNRLWLSRLFIFLILKNINKYAQKGEGVKKFCCNIMLDETAMKWPKNKQNLFVAREIIGMIPIFDKDNTYLKFIASNQWSFDYYKQFKINLPEKFDYNIKFNNLFVNQLEKLAKHIQFKHMHKNITNEVIKANIMHFNKHDHSEEIIKQYQNLIKIVN